MELRTKTADDLFGTHYLIEGGTEKKMEEIGATDGTTFLIRQLFYNIPARRKFLKTPMTEASHVNDVLMRLALSHLSLIHILNCIGSDMAEDIMIAFWKHIRICLLYTSRCV